jgi:hypothetical protein
VEILTFASTIIVALITAVFGPVIVTWTQKRINKTKNKSSVDEAIHLNAMIDEQLEILMDELNCSSIWLAQFHNGGYFYPTGKSIQKFSIFYEKITPEVTSIQTTFQNIPVSLFPKALSMVYNNGEVKYNKNEDDKLDLDVFLKECNSESMYMISLNDLQGRFIGILALSYNHDHKMIKEDWVLLRQKAGVIGTLLDTYLYHKD